MAYFLKKTKLKNRTYLTIYESFYCHDKKGTAHKSFKSLGSIETLVDNGIVVPISFYQNEVDILNKTKADEGLQRRLPWCIKICLTTYINKAAVAALFNGFSYLI